MYSSINVRIPASPVVRHANGAASIIACKIVGPDDESFHGDLSKTPAFGGASQRNYNPFLPQIFGPSVQRIVTRREEETASPKEGRARRETIGTDMTLPREAGEATVKELRQRSYYTLTSPELEAMLAALQRRAAAQRTEIERRQHPLSADLKGPTESLFSVPQFRNRAFPKTAKRPRFSRRNRDFHRGEVTLPAELRF